MLRLLCNIKTWVGKIIIMGRKNNYHVKVEMPESGKRNFYSEITTMNMEFP